MSIIQMNIAAMLAGFLLDVLLGDPEGWPHPVIWMGKFISFMEGKLRKRGGDLRKSALVLSASTVLLSMGVTALALWIASLLGRIALFVLMSLISWTAISARCLAREGRGVWEALNVSLPRARKQLGRIVGRDTENLSGEEIICAAVETIAENTTDGVISPMIYLALGGPVLAMGFKAASTLDSMVGYLNEKYRDIGWASAKLDDALNYVPARVCASLMCLSAGLCGLSMNRAFAIMLRDHDKHLSPNCAWSEAAAAGALGVKLGGTHEYFGQPVEKPSIGDGCRRVEGKDIFRMIRLMYVTALLMALILMIVGLVL